MKHLILGGGYLTKAKDGGQRWVETLLSRAEGEARIAFCLFARDEHEWVRVLQENQEVIKKYAGNTKAEFQTMTPSTFSEVSKWANVIYMTGGDYPSRLKTTLEKCGDALAAWDGKTICGSSAGADVMCKRYVLSQSKQTEEGFGWVAVNFIPHWRTAEWESSDADWDRLAAELANRSSGIPLLCLREGEFVEVELR